jgi:DNA-binding CsgD family transcriptional regulator
LLFYTNPILVNSFMDGGFTILEILVWVIVSELSYDNRVCGVLTGAVTRGVFLLFRLMGVVAAYFLHEFAAGSIISSTMFSIISVYAIGMWMYMVRRNARKNGQVTHPASEDECDDARRSGRESRGQGDGSRDGVTGRNDRRGDRVMEKPRFVDLCNVIDETYNLTQRESEILPYLAQGREAKYIADELYISESTVRTHIKHILEKTGAPSKQGLIDFVYVHGAELLATDR